MIHINSEFLRPSLHMMHRCRFRVKVISFQKSGLGRIVGVRQRKPSLGPNDEQ